MEEIGALFGEEVLLHMTADGRGIVGKPTEEMVEETEVAHAGKEAMA